MVFRGHIKDGKVVLEDAIAVPNGTPVRVELDEQPVRRASKSSPNGSRRRSVAAKSPKDSTRTLHDRLKGIIGAARELPRDFAEQHDHYIHGTPKR